MIGSITLLTGCSVAQPPPIVFTEPDPGTAKLSEAAVSVSHSLSELAGIQKATTPSSAYKLDNTNYAIPGSISVDWSGPIEPLLLQIADVSGYRLRVLGVRPAVQVIVTLTAKDTPLCDIMRDIDYQGGHAAKVSVYPNRIIELRYSPK